MTKHGEVSKVKYVIGSSIFMYVVYWSTKRKKYQWSHNNINCLDLMTWWYTNYMYKKNCEISRASDYTPPPLIICYIDISVSPDLKEIFIIARHVYVWNEALLKILKVGIVSLIKYFGTKKDYCCQRYKRPQNCLINTKSFSEKVEFFQSYSFFF